MGRRPGRVTHAAVSHVAITNPKECGCWRQRPESIPGLITSGGPLIAWMALAGYTFPRPAEGDHYAVPQPVRCRPQAGRPLGAPARQGRRDPRAAPGRG